MQKKTVLWVASMGDCNFLVLVGVLPKYVTQFLSMCGLVLVNITMFIYVFRIYIKSIYTGTVQHSVGRHVDRTVVATSTAIVTAIHATHVNRVNLVIRGTHVTHGIHVTHGTLVNRADDLEEKNRGNVREIIDFQMIFRQGIIGIIRLRLTTISKIHRRP